RGNASQGCVGLLGPPPARCPLSNHPERAFEALYVQATPKVGAVSISLFPSRAQPFQIRLERALARAENVGMQPPCDLAHEAAAVTRTPDDLFYRDTLVEQHHHRMVGVLAAQKTF